MKKVFFMMVISLGLFSVVILPTIPTSTVITFSHGMEH